MKNKYKEDINSKSSIPSTNKILKITRKLDENKILLKLYEKKIIFYLKNKEILELYENGDIYVKGKLVENDEEVVDGLKEFLKGCIKNDNV